MHTCMKYSADTVVQRHACICVHFIANGVIKSVGVHSIYTATHTQAHKSYARIGCVCVWSHEVEARGDKGIARGQMQGRTRRASLQWLHIRVWKHMCARNIAWNKQQNNIHKHKTTTNTHTHLHQFLPESVLRVVHFIKRLHLSRFPVKMLRHASQSTHTHTIYTRARVCACACYTSFLTAARGPKDFLRDLNPTACARARVFVCECLSLWQNKARAGTMCTYFKR